MTEEEGLTITVEKGSGKNLRIEQIWLSGPFEIIGRVRDPKNEGWARLLRWEDDDKRIHECTISDADLHHDPSETCAKLAGQGLKIATGSSRGYFLQYLNSAAVEERLTIVPRTGWHDVDGEKIFALPGDATGNGSIIVSGTVTSPYESNGTLDEWKDSVGKLVADHTRGVFAVSAAFAAPLLALIGEDGGGFNLRGPSSIGKTTLLRASASVWGRADEHGIIKTWRATANGIEGTATMFSDTLLPLDELGIASGQDVGSITYSLSSGIGKQRSQRDGSAKPVNTWRVITLSTGEVGIADKIRESGRKVRAGQEIRIIDLPADAKLSFGVFDNGGADSDPEKLARDICAAAITYYGTAGPAFVKAVLAKGADTIAKIVKESRDAFREEAAAGVTNGQVLRGANRFGLVAAAGELAIEFGIVSWAPGSATAATEALFNEWHAERGGDDPAEIRHAVEQIRHIIEVHGDSRFDPPDRIPDRPVPNRLGYIHGDGQDRQWWIPPGIWRNEFCNGFDHKDVAAALVERGMLLGDSEGKTSRMERVNGKPTRCYVITARIQADAEGGAP